ncbi:MAG: AmmeMemoRadiSam system protein B [Actinomycetota bacterium]
MKTLIRRPTASGSFYPDDATHLEAEVRALMSGSAQAAPSGEPPFALVVPHAGYRYSGPVAASAYGLLTSRWDRIRRVALFGPSHFEPLDGLAVSGAGAWRTPLGDVEVDEDLRVVAVEAGASVDDGPHLDEHALEVQLPWLQVVLGSGVRIAPVAVGWSSPDEVARVIAAVGDAADLVVVSTDLSHYLPLESARRQDRRTADAILARDPTEIGADDACGVFALRGAVELARLRDLDVTLLDLRTSGDTAGGPDRVVGYGAFAIAGPS